MCINQDTFDFDKLLFTTWFMYDIIQYNYDIEISVEDRYYEGTIIF